MFWTVLNLVMTALSVACAVKALRYRNESLALWDEARLRRETRSAGERCKAREGDGTGEQCELPLGHEGGHACPQALRAFLKSRG
jgi:hypothetical protein